MVCTGSRSLRVWVCLGYSVARYTASCSSAPERHRSTCLARVAKRPGGIGPLVKDGGI